MKVMHCGRQTVRRLIIFFGLGVRQPFYFGLTRTPGHLIFGVLGFGQILWRKTV